MLHFVEYAFNSRQTVHSYYTVRNVEAGGAAATEKYSEMAHNGKLLGVVQQCNSKGDCNAAQVIYYTVLALQGTL